MRAIDDDAIERGFTLVEMLITVWIMGALVVTMSGAIFTMIRGSDLTRQRTLVEAELRRYADAVRAAPYQDCADDVAFGSDNYASTRTGQLAGATDSPPTVQYWNADANGQNVTYSALSTVTAAGFCDASSATNDGDYGAQQLTLTVTSASYPSISAQTVVFKRDDAPT